VGSDPWHGNPADALTETDELLEQIRDLLAMQVQGQAGEAQAEWLSTTLGDDVGILSSGGSGGEEDSKESEYYAVNAEATGDVDSINFGSRAETLVIHNVEDAVQVAFKDPGGDYPWITVEPGDSPFKYSGVFGAHAQKIWYRIPEGSAVNSTVFSTLAKFYPGSINPSTGGAGGN
jgi:hypothetical protein